MDTGGKSAEKKEFNQRIESKEVIRTNDERIKLKLSTEFSESTRNVHGMNGKIKMIIYYFQTHDYEQSW